ncbi:ABC transporter related [Methylorubrum populi BJ001]|jgi:simple sugar transport system ATP-binding protein|uniref:ABC transporter related n=2 Tax=Methylorubrum populi TaxID=223967 RepID=B1ZES3_METPB|nr:ABC transporter related [Methylorubrum populi BJ001]OAH30162.1 ABC transporter ATP-binding protein [Methylorubrum populi]PZP70160.1 MAG: ABC transporter ATP-binding protein [Methylorubrum populi]
MLPALEMTRVSKSFDGFPALTEAGIVAHFGEIHALLGENGAGKSTLMNVACGLYRPDAGEIRVRGEVVSITDPKAAKRLGIGMVHQHYKLVKAFTALENIVLARGGPSYGRGLREVEAAALRYCETLGFTLPLDRPVGLLSVAEQQRVEILKVLIEGARILILDEPSAVLTDREAEQMLTTMRRLADEGCAVVLVTHKLGEVKRHADRVTVMRGGRTVGNADPDALSLSELTTLVVGAQVHHERVPAKQIGAPLLRFAALAGARADELPILNDATFVVRAGEIYGIAGIGGNGQTELAEILMGVRRPLAGSIELDGVGDLCAKGARGRDAGLAAIPADRAGYALAGSLSIAENYAVGSVLAGRFGSWFRLDRRAVRTATEAAMKAFDIQGARSPSQRAGLLSGGNAQKLVVAREFSEPPRAVLAHSPSRGLDVRAASAVHARLRAARDTGAAILLISEDLDEVMLLSDRIGVMSRGRIVAEFDAPAPRNAIGAAMVHHA